MAPLDNDAGQDLNEMIEAERHVVLVHPEVHWNTGNIGRTCLGAGARLHLIEPLGFSLDDRHVKRAGLDYWPRVDLRVWPSFKDFRDSLEPSPEEMILLTKSGRHTFWQMPRAWRLFLIFGAETRGLPPAVLARYPQQTFRIPISSQIRSLNLSTAVGIVLYESLRPEPAAQARCVQGGDVSGLTSWLDRPSSRR